ncbi:alcohol dehydrogenase superfamily protein [Cylindrobasidium torrendii FP15055 ss-10]|uniref:Alcohol dehydrogenase superfamily protein n=1 Tax=Cylindrobasidium torrendii FP15055 ss-10 TaxID=1314674 RepID=A0A0D7BDU2_9AGAR|nr:alcohol dehydrogenase superfamily protein [Cylindrobasidium torrendii FP15055 ss-10]
MSTISTSARQFYYPVIGQGWSQLKQRTVPVPTPKSSEVLVKIHAVSLQHRDLSIAKGAYPPSTLPADLIPGSDMAGEIVGLGDDILNGPFKLGDRVCANFSTSYLSGDPEDDFWQYAQGGNSHGVLTDYKTYKPEALVSIPAHLSYEEASTLPCAAVTAYNGLTGGRRPLKAGDTVLVMGTGGVSIFGLQFAVASGATVIVTSSSDAKLAYAKKLGATHGINYTTTPAWEDEVLALTSGKGVDHILEVTGGSIIQSLKAVKMAGQISIIGALASGAGENILRSVIRKGAILRGITVGSVEKFKDMNRLIEANPEKTRPVVDKVFGFDQVIEAFDYLQSQKHVGKVVVSLSQ